MEVDPDERVVYANDNMTQLTGYSLKELVGKRASEVLLNKEARKIIAEEHKKREKGKNSAYEVPLSRKDGTIPWALISGDPI